MCLGVDSNYLAFILDVVVDTPCLRVDSGKLRSTGKWDRGQHLASFGLKNRCRLPASVKRIDLLLARIIQDRVRILASVHFGKCLERFEIDNAGLGFPTVARKAALKLWCRRESVDTRGIGYFANDFVLVEIDDHDL